MVKAILDSKLRIKISDLSQEQKDIIRENFEAVVQDDIIQLYRREEGYYILPANPEYVYKLGIELDIEDRTVAPFISSPEFQYTLHSHQQEWDRQFEKVEYRGILQAGTGNGKSFYAIYLQHKLQTPVLIIANRTFFLENIKKEIEEFSNGDYTIINSKWDGTINRFMITSVQQLVTNPDIINKLYGKIGCIVGDEIHLLMGGRFREVLNSFNVKYKVAMSATPESKSKGFIKKVFSSNIIQTEDVNNTEINVLPIYLNFPSEYSMMSGSHHATRRHYGLNKDYIRAMKEGINHLVNERGRQILIYANVIETQETYKKICDELGIKSIVVNSNTSKSEVNSILEDFENEKYQAIISGSSLTEAVSLYKLSVILYDGQGSPDGSDTKQGIRNTLEQLPGRLRRKKKEICNHSKIFIDLIWSEGCNQKHINAWKHRKKLYESLNGMKVLKMLKSNNVSWKYILDRS